MLDSTVLYQNRYLNYYLRRPLSDLVLLATHPLQREWIFQESIQLLR